MLIDEDWLKECVSNAVKKELIKQLEEIKQNDPKRYALLIEKLMGERIDG